ncbi:MAG: hypothetical protein U0572_04950 [Phycisphaerales bacterium]
MSVIRSTLARWLASCSFLLVAVQGLADSEVTLYYGAANFQPWVSAVQSHSTIDFVGFAPGTFITDQYSGLGAAFNPFVNPYIVQQPDPWLFPQDTYGIDGNGKVRIDFAAPINAIAAHGPGSSRFLLYSQGNLVCVTNWWLGSQNGFAGITTSFTFDRVVFDTPNPEAEVYLDNVYFSTIPAPSAAAAALLLSIGVQRRRRR